jgi:putative ABC transport system permease protein
MAQLKLLRGRFISSTDIEYTQSICVIEQPLADKLFTFEDPLGRHIKIGNDYYKVVGIAEESTGSDNNGAEKDKSVGFYGSSGGVTGNVYIPLSTCKERFSEYTGTMSSGQRSIEKVELQKIVVKTDSFENVMPLRDVVDTLLKRLHKLADYRIIVPLEIIKHAADTQRIFSIVLGSIAAISLLVGGIGIMNIMLATVSERTREIGIRRALGARKKDIIVQFLSETLILTFAGGIVGIILGCIIPFGVTYFANMPTVITIQSLVMAFGISAAIGIIFGLYPAYRAANMDPIESLRHE